MGMQLPKMQGMGAGAMGGAAGISGGFGGATNSVASAGNSLALGNMLAGQGTQGNQGMDATSQMAALLGLNGEENGQNDQNDLLKQFLASINFVLLVSQIEIISNFSFCSKNCSRRNPINKFCNKN